MALVLLGSGKQMMHLSDSLTTSSSSPQKHAHTVTLVLILGTWKSLLKCSEYLAILRLKLAVCVPLSHAILKVNQITFHLFTRKDVL